MLGLARELDERRMTRSRHRETSPHLPAYLQHYKETAMDASVLSIGVGAPLLLGSWWGLLAVPLFMLALGVRAVMEERMLTAELEGYADYAKRVHYRFVPRLW